MSKHIISLIEKNPLTFFGGGIIVFSFILLLLAMAQLFVPFIVIPLTLILLIESSIAITFLSRSLSLAERTGLCFIVLSIIAILLFSKSEPTIMTGRDQGSISMAAIELATHHRLAFSLPVAIDFFHIYGSGEALNFPGFFYTASGDLITKFPLGYTVFLSAFFQTFGQIGLHIGNDLLLLASGISLFFLLRSFAPKTIWAGMLLFTASLIPIFLSHLTLTENFALFLFLFLLTQLLTFLTHHSLPAYIGTLLSATLFPFIRIEGFVFLGLTILLLGLTERARTFIRMDLLRRCILPALFFTLIFIANFFVNNPFYRVIGKELVKSFTEHADTVATASPLALPTLLSLYGLLSIIFAGLIGIIILIREKKWILLVPALIALPTFLYLLSPSITPDHPWMLRRFLFSVYPAFLISFLFALEVLLTHRQFQRKAFALLAVLLFSAEIPALSALTSMEHSAPLLPQVASFANRMAPTDRILIDRGVTGDGFTMPSGPLASLLHRNAAYFFNPLDMGKLSFPENTTTFLLVPEEKSSWYEENLPDFNLTKTDIVNFTLTSRETLPLSIVRFPSQETHIVHNILFEVTPR